MTYFAMHDGKIIKNVIVADNKDIAESVTNLSAIETEGIPWIGWTMEVEGWRPPMPTDGVWEWDDITRDWIAIAPAPEE